MHEKNFTNSAASDECRRKGLSKRAGVPFFPSEGQPAKRRALNQYFIVRQNAGGATLSSRYPPGQAESRRLEVQRITKSMVLNVK